MHAARPAGRVGHRGSMHGDPMQAASGLLVRLGGGWCFADDEDAFGGDPRLAMAASWPLVPPRGSRGQPPKPNVVACAIALSRGERFESDDQALELFGVGSKTKVRSVWVDVKLAKFAPAGLPTPGEEPLPTYLIERREPACAAAPSPARAFEDAACHVRSRGEPLRRS